MSSNRLIYDTCAYKKSLDESVSPLNYTLYPGKYENCSKCRVEFGIVGGNNVSLFSGNLVDLESDLRGQTRVASLCPSKHYQPNCNKLSGNASGIPCGDLESQPKSNNLPGCQMFRYKPTVPTPKQKIYKCDYNK
jgi:hypothetical protein